VLDPEGGLLARHGDIDRPFFIRSAAKPFQALVSQEAGAGLTPQELAIACSSHRGLPVHVAMVETILAGAGLDESALQCPPDWPISPVAARLVQRQGATGPRRLWHNCSGKHSGFLRACVAQGWPVDSYLDPNHPLQGRVVELVSEVGGLSVEPVGVDGCGAPVLRTTTRAMGLLFARLATEPRFTGIFTAMHTYPALIAANGEADTEIAVAIDAVAKGGAAGCLGVAVHRRMGVAVKSWDGLGSVAGTTAARALAMLDLLPPAAEAALEPILHPQVLGGGRPVGELESRFVLGTP